MSLPGIGRDLLDVGLSALRRLIQIEGAQQATVPGDAVSGALGALLGVASSVYVPILMSWSADKYGLIGIAFALQSFLLASAFVVVIGAVVDAVVVERFGSFSVRRLRGQAR